MATVPKPRKLGPLDHGLPMSFEGYMAGDYQEGYRYELIDGRLYVSPEANFPENWVHDWLRDKLKGYARDNPRVINHVCGPGRVFISGRPGTTTPEPDVLAYKNFRLPRRIRDLRWQDFSPILVGEVLSADDPGKDLVRNVALYLQVPSIKEYWIIDAREDADFPTMLVYRRRGRRWQAAIEVGPNETYTTPLLPGFALTLDTRG
ncbi:MAG TPA: Uma2 family endonuclease [Gemmataceae bacterium]|nr:Uma2 family endonuclease [Gemmataceae bacterium]